MRKGVCVIPFLFVTAAGQSPGLPEILETAYNPEMRLLALSVTSNKTGAGLPASDIKEIV